MTEKTRYDQMLQELRRECGILIEKYAPELHKASHEDHTVEILSHIDVVRKIQEDCIRVCTDLVHGITFSGAGEEEVIKEILEYNYDEADIEHMIKIEGINLFSHLQMLNKNCIKRTDRVWFLIGIHEQLQNGRVNLGPLGSMRTQFCKCCGEQIYISTNGSRQPR